MSDGDGGGNIPGNGAHTLAGGEGRVPQRAATARQQGPAGSTAG